MYLHDRRFVQTKFYKHYLLMLPERLLQKSRQRWHFLFLQGVFDEDPEVYKCAEAQKKYMGFNDGNAAKRIVDYMEKEFGL